MYVYSFVQQRSMCKSVCIYFLRDDGSEPVWMVNMHLPELLQKRLFRVCEIHDIILARGVLLMCACDPVGIRCGCRRTHT